MNAVRFGVIFQIFTLLVFAFYSSGCFLNSKITGVGTDDSSIDSGSPILESISVPAQASGQEGQNISITLVKPSTSSRKKDYRYEIVPVTAVNGVNYIATSGTISFAIGETQKSISISTNEVGLGMSGKTLKVRFFDSENKLIGETQVEILPVSQVTKMQNLYPIIPSSLNYIDRGSYILFAKNNSANGNELWRTDNTPGGTYLVKDICVGTCSADPNGFVEMGGFVYFVAKESASSGSVIYKTDGTLSGTTKIFEYSQISIIAGHENSESIFSFNYCPPSTNNCNGPSTTFIASSDRIFFVLYNSTNPAIEKYTWFSTQGSISSTRSLAPVDDPPRLTSYFNGNIVVSNEDELFRWDGTTNNAWIRITGNAGWNCGGTISGTYTIAGKFYFICYDYNLGGNRIFTMASDFSYTGTGLLTGFSVTNVSALGASYYYYYIWDGINSDIYRTDGTVGGTVKVLDGITSYSTVLGNVNSKTIMHSGTNIYQTDGTLSGTSVIKTIAVANTTVPLGSIGGFFYFQVDGQLFKTDAPLIGVGSTAVLSPDGEDFLLASALGSAGGYLFFKGKTASRGIESWRIDPSGNIQLISERNSGVANSHGTGVYNFLGSTFINSVDDVGNMLYKLDGSLNTTKSEIKYWANPLYKDWIQSILVHNGKLYWTQFSGQNASELKSFSVADGLKTETSIASYGSYNWQTLLGSAGNSIIFSGYLTMFDHRYGLSYNPQTATLTTMTGIIPKYLVKLDNNLSVISSKSITTFSNTDWEPWVTNGTIAGSTLLSDIVAGTSGSSPEILGIVNSKVLLSTSLGIYKTDGTAPGTTFIVQPGFSAVPVSPVVLGNKIVFFGTTAAEGREIWVADESGSNILVNIGAGAASGATYMYGKNAAGTLAYFLADDGISGLELWKTDGTVVGTVMIKDVCVGSCHSKFQQLPMVEFQGKNYIWRAVDNSGTDTYSHLWSTDGSPAGTVLVKDFLPKASIGAMYSNSTSLFFTLNLPPDTSSRELWRLKPSASSECEKYPETIGTMPDLLGTYDNKLIFTDIPSSTQIQGFFLAK